MIRVFPKADLGSRKTAGSLRFLYRQMSPSMWKKKKLSFSKFHLGMAEFHQERRSFVCECEFKFGCV